LPLLKLQPSYIPAYHNNDSNKDKDGHDDNTRMMMV